MFGDWEPKAFSETETVVTEMFLKPHRFFFTSPLIMVRISCCLFKALFKKLLPPIFVFSKH